MAKEFKKFFDKKIIEWQEFVEEKKKSKTFLPNTIGAITNRFLLEEICKLELKIKKLEKRTK